MPCQACEERRKKLLALLDSLKGAATHVVREKMLEFRRSMPEYLVDKQEDQNNA